VIVEVEFEEAVEVTEADAVDAVDVADVADVADALPVDEATVELPEAAPPLTWNRWE